jgi:hypothetical protein
MEDHEQMRRYELGIEKKEKVQKDKSSQHGTKGLLFKKKNHQKLKSSHNTITYSIHATLRSP